ncbi:PTS lactose/cellobiose transporter subunit IIB [Actinoplanes friuliensis]|uniref:PTS system lactose/cellobiose-specific transporter subunit IIB n=1 Tax=Actinoplanes friuliensis DSM 7358 TaxID=1246995 RepID=U5VPZ5_9ACTN|nr:PTS lactose/cellobiose transporter subunit IIB [Actinoplanes friuliensis]AGZ38882.1 PTS system lactose/cellobiose-specific transporter subunit IIB [Actinoplanes friuliensis DSM 7358]
MSTIDGSAVRKLVVACDAGMGSSVMLASQLKREFRKLPVLVEHHPVSAIPADADVVLCQAGLAARARAGAPGAVVVGFRMFLGDPHVAQVVAAVKQGGPVVGTAGG